MRTTRKVRIGVVCGLLASAALHSTANAADTPPALKQTGTVVVCKPPTICIPIGSSEHLHKAVANSSLVDGEKFRINRKFLSRHLRFIDLQDKWFDKMQDPDLHLVNGDRNPLSFDSFEIVDPDCVDIPVSDCVKIRDFPIAFGIHDLENANGTVSPHAFVYIPVKLFWNDGFAALGDRFWLLILHIPDKDGDCDHLPTPPGTPPPTAMEKRHCRLTVKLKDVWRTKKYSQKELTRLVAGEYRRYFDHVLDDYKIDNSAAAANSTDPSILKTPAGLTPGIHSSMLPNIVLVILLHNDIIHGKLQ